MSTKSRKSEHPTLTVSILFKISFMYGTMLIDIAAHIRISKKAPWMNVREESQTFYIVKICRPNFFGHLILH